MKLVISIDWRQQALELLDFSHGSPGQARPKAALSLSFFFKTAFRLIIELFLPWYIFLLFFHSQCIVPHGSSPLGFHRGGVLGIYLRESAAKALSKGHSTSFQQCAPEALRQFLGETVHPCLLLVWGVWDGCFTFDYLCHFKKTCDLCFEQFLVQKIIVWLPFLSLGQIFALQICSCWFSLAQAQSRRSFAEERFGKFFSIHHQSGKTAWAFVLILKTLSRFDWDCLGEGRPAHRFHSINIIYTNTFENVNDGRPIKSDWDDDQSKLRSWYFLNLSLSALFCPENSDMLLSLSSTSAPLLFFYLFLSRSFILSLSSDSADCSVSELEALEDISFCLARNWVAIFFM